MDNWQMIDLNQLLNSIHDTIMKIFQRRCHEIWVISFRNLVFTGNMIRLKNIKGTMEAKYRIFWRVGSRPTQCYGLYAELLFLLVSIWMIIVIIGLQKKLQIFLKYNITII